MFSFLTEVLSNIIFFILHITSGNSFPKPLSAKEEKKYISLCKNADKDARSKLIEHNLRLVAHIVKKYSVDEDEADDLISIGTIGLIKAIDSFDENKGIRLSSYAARCIENEILMYFRSKKKSRAEISLNEPIDTDKDGNTLTLIDTIAYEEDMVDLLDTKIKSEHLKKLIYSSLTHRERTIIVLRYGLHGGKPLTQREISQKLGISRSYVSRIEKHAVNILKKQMNK